MVCEADRKGIGTNYYYIAAKEGYTLVNVYNRDYDSCTIGIDYFDVQSGTYIMHLSGTLASGAVMKVMEVWVKN